VFEQPVVNKISYQFYHDEMVELQHRGIDINKLSEVNGREYQSARALLSSLDKIDELSREQKITLSSITQVQKLKIDYTLLRQNLKEEALTPVQWSTLKTLDGKSYNHLWQLEYDLRKLSPEWISKPKSNKNQFYNSDLQKAYKVICSQSKVTIESTSK
jgi:hypothetical protein